VSSRPVRVIVVNADEEAGPELRALLLSVEGVKIVAEIDEPVLLGQALAQFPAEALLIHLDPSPAGIMEVIGPLIAERKGQLAAIAMTEDRDAELVMQAMRAGIGDFLWKPFPPEDLTAILRRIGHEAPSAGRRAGRLIPVVAACGGVGATTVATNLAVELAQVNEWADGAGKPKVAVVDLDFRFGQVAMFLDAQATYTVAELCDTPEHIEAQMIERVVVKHPSGVHVLSIPHDIEQAQRISAAQCAGVLAALMEHYDFVVVDGPVRFDPSARAVFDMTDTYLIVLQLLVPPVRNTDRLLREMARGGYNLDQVRLLCNRYGRDAGYLEPADVETSLGRDIWWMLPDDWKTASMALNVGAPLLEHAPKTKLRQAFQEMARAIANRTEPGAEPGEGEGDGESRRKGLFPFLSS
jgi:pilus assembly protein CpaE